jgi:uncharacterized protein YgiM (DUF1202 family)
MKTLTVILVLIVTLLFQAGSVSALSPYAKIYKPVCVRPAPVLSAKCWANVKKGETVTLGGIVANNFYKVYYKGRVGWIYKTKLTIVD